MRWDLLAVDRDLGVTRRLSVELSVARRCETERAHDEGDGGDAGEKAGAVHGREPNRVVVMWATLGSPGEARLPL
jgi:hypothetical protein